MARRQAREPSQRQLRVGEAVRHALAWCLERGEVHDPDLEDVSVTVTEVRMNGDLSQATAFVMRLGDGDVTPVVAALERATPFLRHRIAREVPMRYVPHLRFRADDRPQEAARIESLLQKPDVARDLPDADEETESRETAPEDDGHGA